LVGCGTVGGAVARILLQNGGRVSERSGVGIELAAIVSRRKEPALATGIDAGRVYSELQPVLDNPSIDLVVELTGGLDYADEVITRALEADKHVVTANKALLAHRGRELFALARKRGLSIGFEASCGGGIPIIRAITDGLVANHVDALYGIVNGTSNFILSEMIHRGESYPQALAAAQAQGLAEADPTLDVDGTDSAHKLAIMASLAFGGDVRFDAIPVEGIDNLSERDVAFGRDLGYVVKLLAVAHRIEGGITAWVRPAFISSEHPLAWVGGPFNAISVYGHTTGHTLYYGRGAGGDPTAGAVIADIIGMANGVIPAIFAHTGFWPDRNHNGALIPMTESTSRFYVRIMALDKPGVLASISAILGEHAISIASLRQNEQAGGDVRVPVVITTHRCREASIRAAIEEIDRLAATADAAVCMPIVEEHPEYPSN
jgi:homoserine dehydrogenase